MALTLTLIPHPAFPPRAIEKVEVDIRGAETDELSLTYRVYGTVPVLSKPKPSRRADGLWQTTCFELFLRQRNGSAYSEFNFSPSGEWAAYAFDRYREGMRNLPLGEEPFVASIGSQAGSACTIKADVERPLFPEGVDASLCAVIEEVDGTKSYWALAHPAEKPDFHDPACFVLELPAPPAP